MGGGLRAFEYMMFNIESSRFQRYIRKISLDMIDISVEGF